jgi:hypothetical protein
VRALEPSTQSEIPSTIQNLEVILAQFTKSLMEIYTPDPQKATPIIKGSPPIKSNKTKLLLKMGIDLLYGWDCLFRVFSLFYLKY